MAFVSQSLPQEEQNQFAPQGQTTPNPLALLPPQAAQSGGSTGQGGGSQAGGAPGVGTPTQFGSNASKLSDYLKANQDQVQTMANQVAGQIGGQYNTVKGAVDAAGQQFGQQVQGGYTPTDPTLLQQVQNDPVAAAGNPGNVSAFQKQLNDTYTGPTSFEGSDLYGGVQQKVTDAVQQSQLLGTYPGISGYLQNNVEKNATPGQNTLDSVLLQSSQPAYQTVQDAAKPFAGLQDYLGQLATTQNQGVQQAQQAAPAAQQAARAALQGATNNLNTGVNNELQAAVGQAQGYNQQVQKAQGDVANDIPLINGLRDIMSQYGAGFLGAQAPWADASKVSIPNQAMQLPTAAQAATPKDYATLAALSQLSGGPITSPIDATTADQAGSFKAPGAVDRSQLQHAFDAMQQFILSPAGNNINVASSANLNPFVNSANDWYNQLINAFGYDYPGSGARPAPFTVGNPPGPGMPGGIPGKV